MAAGHVKKWLKSRTLANGTTATATSYLGGDARSPIPAEIAATRQETTSSGSPYTPDSKMASEDNKKMMRFRILVIGRANSGKTTILQRVCNSTHKPRIFDGKGNMIESDILQSTLTRGYHDIEQELVFQSNPAFVFHDSCGFEAGSAQEFDQMKAFVADRAAARNMNERLHAIWFCIPMTDSHRLVTLAEQKFFNECDTRHVPVIVVLTKVDALYLTAMRMLLDGGSAISEARERAITMQGALLEKFLGNLKHVLHMCKFPPKEYVVLHKMHQPDGDCTALMQCTAHALNEEGLWISPMLTKQTSIAMSIQHAVYWVVERMLLRLISGGERPDMKAFESKILYWFPNHESFERLLGDLTEVGFEYKTNEPSKDVTIQSIAEHGVASLLIFEYCYFLLTNQVYPEGGGVIQLAVKKYKNCGVAATIHQAVETAVQFHSQNVDNLCQTLVEIILENCMSCK